MLMCERAVGISEEDGSDGERIGVARRQVLREFFEEYKWTALTNFNVNYWSAAK